MKTTAVRPSPANGTRALEALAEAVRRAIQVGENVRTARRALDGSVPLIVGTALSRIERAQQRLIEEIEAAETYIEESGLA